MVGVGVSPGPVLLLPVRPVLIFLPKFLDRLPHLLGRPDLLESQFGVILHAGRLSDGHFDAISLREFARRIGTRGAVMRFAGSNHVVVLQLFVAKVLDGHADILGRRGMIVRIDVVRQPWIIGGDCGMMNGKGDVDAVGGLAEGVDVLSVLGIGIELMIIILVVAIAVAVAATAGGPVLVAVGNGVAPTPQAERQRGRRGRGRDERIDAECAKCNGSGGNGSPRAERKRRSGGKSSSPLCHRGDAAAAAAAGNGGGWSGWSGQKIKL